MPPPPRFKSPRHQHRAVGAAMFALFAVAMVAAYAMAPSNWRSVHIHGLNLRLPSKWQHDPQGHQVMSKQASTSRLACFSHADRPEAKLTVVQASMNTMQQQALLWAMRVLLPPAGLRRLQHVTDSFRSITLQTLHGFEYIGFATSDDGPIETYFVAALTRDGHTYWLITLIDRVLDPEALKSSILSNNKAFDELLYSASLHRRARSRSPAHGW